MEEIETEHVEPRSISGMSDFKKQLKRWFAEREVSHYTIEIETTDEACDDLSCSTTEKR